MSLVYCPKSGDKLHLATKKYEVPASETGPRYIYYESLGQTEIVPTNAKFLGLFCWLCGEQLDQLPNTNQLTNSV